MSKKIELKKPKTIKYITVEEIEEQILLEYQIVELNEIDWAFKGYFKTEDSFINLN